MEDVALHVITTLVFFNLIILIIIYNSKISLIPNTYTKKITSIEQWTTAFIRFAAIYGRKYHKEMSKLMKYAEIISPG